MDQRWIGIFALTGLALSGQVSSAAAAPQKGSRVTALVEPTGDRETDLRLLVQKRGLSEKLAKLTGLFPPSATGKAMAAVATLYPFGLRSDNRADSTLLAAQLGTLGRNPSQALSELSQALPKLPAAYAGERQFLIQFAARLPLPASQVLAFLGDELKRPVAAPSADGPADLSFFNPAVALDSMMEVTRDRSVLEGYLVPVLGSPQVGMEEKQLLLSRYYTVYPSNAEKMGERFGIEK